MVKTHSFAAIQTGMTKRKGQYFAIILLFLATNTLYFFAERDTQKLNERSVMPVNAQADNTPNTDTLLHFAVGTH